MRHAGLGRQAELRPSAGRLRPLRAVDLPAVLRIQREAYGDGYQESAAVLGRKLQLAPQGCWGAEAGGELIAYLFAHPWWREVPPPLHVPLERLPAAADSLFVHDLAVSARARGGGLAAGLLARVARRARADGHRWLNLVALADAVGYWRRHGFVPVAGGGPLPAGYGEGALFMQCRLAGHESAEADPDRARWRCGGAGRGCTGS